MENDPSFDGSFYGGIHEFELTPRPKEEEEKQVPVPVIVGLDDENGFIMSRPFDSGERNRNPSNNFNGNRLIDS